MGVFPLSQSFNTGSQDSRSIDVVKDPTSSIHHQRLCQDQVQIQAYVTDSFRCTVTSGCFGVFDGKQLLYKFVEVG